MNKLYKLSEAKKYEQNIKRFGFILYGGGFIVLLLTSYLTIFFPITIVLIINIFLTSIYLSTLYIYLFFFRKTWRDLYQFLAEIQHFPHFEIKGQVLNMSDEVITMKNRSFVAIMLTGEKIVFVEEVFKDEIVLLANYKFITVENIVISLMEMGNHD